MEPCSAAEVDSARPASLFDPCGGVDRVAPDVELELRLAHDSGRDRPVIDTDPHCPVRPELRAAATMSRAQATAARTGSSGSDSRLAVAMNASPIVLIFSSSC